MAEMVEGVKVYSDEDEVMDYINEVLPADIRSLVLKMMDVKTGQDVIYPFIFSEGDRHYYAVLMRLDVVDDLGSLLLFISKEKESIYKYIQIVIDNAEDDVRDSLINNQQIIKHSFEQLEKQLANESE